jgi:hypothetical protein
VTDTVAAFDTAPWPSATVYRNVSVPVNVPLGVYVTAPLPLGTAVPFDGEVTIATEAALIPASSVSFDITLIATGVPFVVVAVSFTATGGWFFALTVTVTVAVFDTSAWVSATVYVNVSVPV